MKTAILDITNVMDAHFYGLSTGDMIRTRKELEAFGIDVPGVWSDLDEVLKRHITKAASKEVK
jgi:hypothetical protein